VEIDAARAVRDAGYAPYLDYRPSTPEERTAVEAALKASWLSTDLEPRAIAFAVERLVPEHLREVRGRREELVRLTMDAVRDRLTKEITYWDHRALDLKEQERAGKQPKMNAAMAERRADELQARLRKRMEELQQERQVSALPPVVVGGALVVPAGALTSHVVSPDAVDTAARAAARRAEVERLAVEAVVGAERRLGRIPTDVGARKLGYDVESEVPGDGRLLFIEVKGRTRGADTITVTKNEILTALNMPDDFILAIVEVDRTTHEPRYLRRPFRHEPDFEVTSVTYDLREL
jgi:hypothetical protein